MDRIAFLQRLRNEVLILDGAMGTLLQPDLPPGACLDLAVLEKPDRVCVIVSAYAAAGADIISTNTFGANRVKLSVYGLADKVKTLNHAAAVLARKSAGDGVL